MSRALLVASVVIPADVAAWIRDVVLPPAYRRNSSDPAKCDCQYGVCYGCQKGRHAECMVVAWGGAPRAHPETYICDSRGMVPGHHGVINQVWRAGRPCRWICACTDCPPVPAPPLGGVPASYQLDLFANLAAETS